MRYRRSNPSGENLSGHIRSARGRQRPLCALFFLGEKVQKLKPQKKENLLMDRKTPLYPLHAELEGTIVSFGGFLLPVQYKTGIIAEHRAVRENVGIFDVSHMGEATLEGPDALANLDRILTNRFDSMAVGACRYTIMLYEDGGCVDDLIVYRRGEQQFFLVLNASNAEKDVAWLAAHLEGRAELRDRSADYAQIAVQGPNTPAVMRQLTDPSLLPVKYYSFCEHVPVAGADCLVSRTGYTGEFGYEIYLKPEDAPKVFRALMAAGAVPCGLGARDTLRLEAGMPLYGHEISEKIDPLTAGLDFAVKLDKDFIGRSALLAKGAPTQKRVGLKVTGRGIVREHQPVYVGGEQVGVTTSGTFCPWLNVSCAMAYLDLAHAQPGTAVEVDVRGRRVPCEVVSLPFYNRAKG